MGQVLGVLLPCNAGLWTPGGPPWASASRSPLSQGSCPVDLGWLGKVSVMWEEVGGPI